MKFLSFLILFLIFQFSNAQSITLRVLGKATYVEYAKTNGIIISFNEKELKVKKTKLTDTILSIGIKNKLVPFSKTNTRNRFKFRLEENNLKIFDNLLVICSDLGIKIDKIYYKIPEHKFEDEDENAILAINNATSQAKIIANNLHYKIVKILNIDDDTTYADPIYDRIDIESERGKMLIRLLQLLGNRNYLKETETKNPIRQGGYNIWVTYKLKPI